MGGFDDRRRGGVGFGLEFFESEEGAGAGAAGGIDAVLESGEGVGVAGDGLTEGELLRVAVRVVVLVLPGLGFGEVEAAEGPLAADEVIDECAGVGGGGTMVAVVGADEVFEVGEFLGGEDEGLGVESGFEGVHGGGGLAGGRGGAGGVLGVTAVGFDLTESGHGMAPGGRAWLGCTRRGLVPL
jgi:hypothetical protein